MERLYKCIKKKKVNHSRAREAIFQVLLENEECLSVSSIIDRVATTYPKKYLLIQYIDTLIFLLSVI